MMPPFVRHLVLAAAVSLTLVAVRAAEPPQLPLAPNDTSPPAARDRPAEVPPAAAPLPPAPLDSLRPALDRVKKRRAAVAAAEAGFPPFDLTYYSRVESPGLMAFRPAALAPHLPPGVGDGAIRWLIGVACATAGGDIMAAVPPAFADVEQVVAAVTASVTPAAAGRPMQHGVHSTSACVRTPRPFDWDRAVRKWFPRAEAVTHRSRTYYRIVLAGGPTAGTGGLWVPDDRTFLYDSEENVRRLIDRLADGKGGPAQPAGWDRVSRDLIAFATDGKKYAVVTANPDNADARAVAEGVEAFAVGWTVTTETRVRAAVTLADGAFGPYVLEAAKRALQYDKWQVQQPEAGQDVLSWQRAKQLYDSATITRDGRTTHVAMTCDADALRILFRSRLGAE